MEKRNDIPPQLSAELELFPGIEKTILSLHQGTLKAYRGTLYPLDFYVQGAVKRSLSQTRAMRSLLETFNLVCARSMLRLQIDTAMRLQAAWLVEDPHKFAQEVVGGKQVNKFKDKHGNRLTDSFLAKELSKRYEWVYRVYKETSGYVHLSESQFIATVEKAGEDRTLNVVVGPDDRHMPIESFVEVAQCFIEVTAIVCEYLHGWLVTKDNPDLVDDSKNRTSES